jgi:hypothetical protein
LGGICNGVFKIDVQLKALAFGLGGKDAAAKYIEELRKKRS